MRMGTAATVTARHKLPRTVLNGSGTGIKDGVVFIASKHGQRPYRLSPFAGVDE